MRLAPIAVLALGVPLVLSGCPGLPGFAGNQTLTPQVLAITASDQGSTTAAVNLTWNNVNNAATYQVLRAVASGSPKVRATVTSAAFNEPVGPNLSITYTIQAFSPTGDLIVGSAPTTINVLDAQVQKPTNLTVDGKAASADSAVPPATSKPVLAWTNGGKATGYYVTLNEVGDGNSPGKLAYAALTQSPTATVGTLPLPNTNLAGFTQVAGGGLTKGKNYYYSVTAIRGDNADLSKVTAIDTAVIDAPAKISNF